MRHASERVREYAKEHAGAELCDYVHTDILKDNIIHTYMHTYNTPHKRIVPMYLE